MRSLSSILVFLGLAATLFAQSPHGVGLKYDCAACHTPAGWEIPFESWRFDELLKPIISRTTGRMLGYDTLHFNHYKTEFPLLGQHASVDCRLCHPTLVFSEASTDCISCHTDMHNQTVGMDCARCHNSENWLVNNVTELHLENGFPLLGAHATVNCQECHVSASTLTFERIGNDCINCHQPEFSATTNPNHSDAGFSTDCGNCHDINKFDWSTDIVNHDFFPLTKGHELSDCAACHTGGSYSSTPNDCVACHQPAYTASLNPKHQAANFSTNCAECHTTDPGWMPAQYAQHDDAFFPIYSGKHEGEWTQCVDCHANQADFTLATCTNCHENPKTDTQHNGIGGYSYNDPACLACHPTGSAEDKFDHNATHFPLTGAHTTIECLACHADGFQGTPTACAACHTTDFNQTANPKHQTLGFSTDCASCHTTAPDWMPATFANHNDFYALNGAHAGIANDCAACHNGDYTNTPNTCFGCHAANYNQTTHPNHKVLQFSNDCASCHTESAWTPSTFDHDGQYFPIYSGKHKGEWSQCMDCHTNPSDYGVVTCTTCHANPETDNQHNGVGGYSYNSSACLACHPTGSAEDKFDHNLTNFPLTGAHTAIECLACHADGFRGTPTECAACHTPDFNQTANPNHQTLGFSTDCASCHTTAPDWMPATFANHNDFYALNGAHTRIATDCAACHNGDYTNTPNTCFGCHAANYNQTTDPNHATLQFSTDCASCHTENAWAPASFDHSTTNFPLTGAHTTVECMACHADGFQGTPTACAACHTTDFNQAANPNHQALGFSTDCASCHTTAPDWMPATFANHNDFYALNGAHARIATDCAACHNGEYTNTPNTCFGCHAANYNQTTDPNHASLQFSTDCASCHTENAWAPASFDHSTTNFPLTGAHTTIECLACHADGFQGTPTACAACHTTDFNQTANPKHQTLGFSTDCASCHTTAPDWMPATFANHNDFYALNGAHAGIANDCAACHNGEYTNTPNTCFGCHAMDYKQTTDPNHAMLQFSTDCASCHTESAWTPSTFDHDGQHFPIYSGKHKGEWSQCVDCHTNPSNYGVFTCTTCHANPETTNQHNGVGGYSYNSTACLACHPTGSAEDKFDHNLTNFPLTGAHTAIECLACHANGYQGTPTECAACHTTDFNQTANPNHQTLGFSTDCASCHTTAPDWMPATFANHNDFYALNGAHARIATDCAACHNGDYTNTPNTCFGCHAANYNQTTDPNHATLQFSTDCASCHTENAWAPASFDHSTTNFPLTGAHTTVECMACHADGFQGTPTACAACHTTDFNQAANPNHQALGFSTDCASCHTTAPDWMPATFANHNDFYALNGAHARIATDCAACHNGEYTNTPNTCFGCHAANYDQTADPNHASLQFSTDCASCHTENAWAPASFDHSTTNFPLTGAHTTIECLACHADGFQGTPTACAACHTTDFNQTANPKHQTLGFSTDCASCHTTAPDWMPATFANHNDFYALNGAHASIANDCAACHNGEYTNTPNTCFGCHAMDYKQTTDPNHAMLQFSTDCASCHTESAWTPSTFDHDGQHFPIYSGKHKGEWSQCVDCHTNPSNYGVFTCTTCHINPETNDKHNGIGGYSYNSTSCYACHPTGSADDKFDHNFTQFPLTDAHTTIECLACHANGYQGTPTECAACHTPDFNQTANPNHRKLGFSTDCASCHTTAPDWMPATFAIHNDYYVLNGAHARIATDCAACHNGDYTNTPNTCFGCHSADYKQTTDPNHLTAQFPTDCQACHSENAWSPATFDHDGQYFPIYRGKHKEGEVWNQCTECHKVPTNYAVFSCIDCHQHNNPKTLGEKHKDVSGYAYSSDACFACHPRGN